MASNDDIMLALGRLQEGVDRLRDDFQDEKRIAHESRAVIHHRLDAQAQQIAHMETTIAISGQIDAQIRSELTSLKDTVERNQSAAAPMIAEWGRLKTLGVGISGLIALAGLTIGSIVAWAGEALVASIRQWLKIS